MADRLVTITSEIDLIARHPVCESYASHWTLGSLYGLGRSDVLHGRFLLLVFYTENTTVPAVLPLLPRPRKPFLSYPNVFWIPYWNPYILLNNHNGVLLCE